MLDVSEAESVTLTVAAQVPVVAVPARTPVDPVRVTPQAVNDPLVIDQVYGVVPPAARNVNEYATPFDPGGKAHGGVPQVGALIVGTAVTVNWAVPTTGAPLIVLV
jgi:hypothetical protein